MSALIDGFNMRKYRKIPRLYTHGILKDNFQKTVTLWGDY